MATGKQVIQCLFDNFVIKNSPISFPKIGNTGINHSVVNAHFEVVENNLNLQIFSFANTEFNRSFVN